MVAVHVRPRADRELDLVVQGASGFAGRLLARYLAEHAPPGLRIALAGRSRERLAAVRDELGGRARAWPLVVADAHDDTALAALARSTRVVATTVGPYARYGLPLAAACAYQGTDYVDLSGEVLFMRASIDANDAAARSSGARVVHACGFDSIPSDLSVFLLARTAAAHGLGTLTDTRFVLTGASGGFSGGTVDSLRAQVEQVRAEPRLADVLADPYALSPARAAEPAVGGREHDPSGITWDPDARRWLAPFVMGPVNSRVVRRSNALSSYSYGRQLRYREAVGVPGRITGAPVAAALAAGQLTLGAGMSFAPTRALLDRVLPSVGAGSDQAARDSGYFAVRVYARTTSGARLQARVAAQGDPGYAATARMLGESALALVVDSERLPDRAGVLTPATGIGEVLIDRLRAAGMTLQVL